MTKSLEQQIKYHEKVANNPNYVKVYDNLGNWIQAHRCADLLNKQSEKIIALQNENAQLKADYESLGEDYSDAQHQIALYEINWPREKDLNRLKADAVLEEKDKKIAELEVDLESMVAKHAQQSLKIAELDRKLLQYQDDYFGGAE